MMLNRNLRPFALIAALLACMATGCSTVKTSILTPTGPLEPGQRSYSWVADPTGAVEEPGVDAAALHRMVTDAVNTELNRKGWDHLASGTPDLSLDYTIHVTPSERAERAENDDYVSGMRWARGTGWEAVPAGVEETVLLYEKGTLAIRMNNPAGDTVWLGSVAVELHAEASPARERQRIGKIVRRLLRDF